MTYGFFFLLLLLLITEGFFAASEIALISANRRRLRRLAEEGHRGAKAAVYLLSQPEYLLATTLLGAYMAAAANGVLITVFLIDLLGSTGEVLAALFLPPFLLILAEITPKSIGRQRATSLALALSPLLRVISWIVYPFTLIFSALSRVVLFVARARQPSHLPFVTREDLHLVVTKSGPEMDLETPERRIIKRILHFSLRTVKEAMVPLVRVVAIPDTTSVAQALEEFRASRYSRLAVYHRRIDNLVGVLHDFDLLGEEVSSRSIRSFVRPVHYVPETKKIDHLLPEMQRQGIHLAVVVDEYGGTAGIVTIEDLLEEIVGEIDDEFDQAVTPYKKLGEGHYLISARQEVDALNEALHLDLPLGDYETLGGFITAQMGDLPRTGEQVRWRNLRFVVRLAEARSVREVELFVEPPTA
jgi:magnesium and cobalt exporter, CNNM family